MNVNGRAKLLNIVEDGKVLKGKIYYSTNVAPKESEPKWETDFINVRIVGKAKKENRTKLPKISRLKNYLLKLFRLNFVISRIKQKKAL